MAELHIFLHQLQIPSTEVGAELILRETANILERRSQTKRTAFLEVHDVALTAAILEGVVRALRPSGISQSVCAQTNIPLTATISQSLIQTRPQLAIY